MHEASLVEGLLKIALQSLNDYQAANPGNANLRIKELVCELGLLSGVEKETLRACFELFSENTPAEGARLTLATPPLKCRCEDCQARFDLLEKRFICPECQGCNIKFSNGNYFVLQAINIDCGDKPND